MLSTCNENGEETQWMVVTIIIITVFSLEFMDFRHGNSIGQELLSVGCECDPLESLRNMPRPHIQRL